MRRPVHAGNFLSAVRGLGVDSGLTLIAFAARDRAPGD
jgi:hypothetical protein